MLPNFLCIGSQKAGTSWLYDMLKQHPDIWLPDIKEVHYYDYYFGEGTGAKQWAPKHIEKAMERIRKKKHPSSSDKAYINGLKLTKPLSKQWYSALFNHAQAYERKLKGEITPEYSAINEEGVKRIREDLGDIKIIWLIRDPVDRAISHTKMVINRSKLNPELINEDNLEKYVRFKGRADYIKTMPIWEKYFTDILYLPYGDIKSQPVHLLNQLSDFLDVKKMQHKNTRKIVHKTKPVDLTSSAIKVLEIYSMPQYDFLEKKFGSEFMARVK